MTCGPIKILVSTALLMVTMQTAMADGCVIGLTLTGDKRAYGLAVGDLVAANTYQDLATCNREMAVIAAELPRSLLAKAMPVDSLTFVCKVPSECVAVDDNTVRPFERVVFITK